MLGSPGPARFPFTALLPVWCGPRRTLTHPLRMSGERRCGKDDPMTVRPFGDRRIISCIVAALMNSLTGPSRGNFFEPRSRWRKECSNRAPACTCYAAFVKHLRNARCCSSLSMPHTGTPARARVPTGGRDPSVSKRRVRWEAMKAEEKRREEQSWPRVVRRHFPLPWTALCLLQTRSSFIRGNADLEKVIAIVKGVAEAAYSDLRSTSLPF